ncbi:type VII secretion protein EccB [Streptomyces sp. NPDC051561]|uniref:type VII secretion protein EccB n=1 Tax=Streptomyces sp. NPDC051561 TaxID=3365658 RepID=UPI0037B04DD3
MASRRDELNAYAYAKRRLVAQFLRPSPTGSEEGAPRPLRAVLPGVLVGAVVLAGFGVWGMFDPAAPRNWRKPYENIIVARESTTRYVVLTTNGKHKLHPVLNMASARLLVDGGDKKVVKVNDEILDRSGLERGATVGIPYAPDRVPERGEVGSRKLWAACTRAQESGGRPRTTMFVLAERERDEVENGHRLRGGQLLYVATEDGRYVVDATGTAYPIGTEDEVLLNQVVGARRVPQRVPKEWLRTLHRGSEIVVPDVPGAGRPSRVPGLRGHARTVGRVLATGRGGSAPHYVVLAGRVVPVSPFVAYLLLNSKKLEHLGQGGSAEQVSRFFAVGADFAPYEKSWPRYAPQPVAPARTTLCTVLRSVDGTHGTIALSTWAAPDFPRPLPTGTASAYVTPGSGQYFRQISGTRTDTGPYFLLTDTGLRHSLQVGGFALATDAKPGGGPDLTSEKVPKGGRAPLKTAQELLGYEGVKAAPVPAVWSSLLPTGPRLSTGGAVQMQGS